MAARRVVGLLPHESSSLLFRMFAIEAGCFEIPNRVCVGCDSYWVDRCRWNVPIDTSPCRGLALNRMLKFKPTGRNRIDSIRSQSTVATRLKSRCRDIFPGHVTQTPLIAAPASDQLTPKSIYLHLSCIDEPVKYALPVFRYGASRLLLASGSGPETTKDARGPPVR